ncbi:Uncharacterised protein [Vibrio cholerae]|nr:Uncharacterised protein [Vibrio cholerae]
MVALPIAKGSNWLEIHIAEHTTNVAPTPNKNFPVPCWRLDWR